MASLSIGLRARPVAGADLRHDPLSSASPKSAITASVKTIDGESLRDRRFTAFSHGPQQAPPSTSARTDSSQTSYSASPDERSPPQQQQQDSRSKLDSRDRRLAKLRRRAKTMEPPVLSFYGQQPLPLPSRFASIKRKLVAGHEEALKASWGRLIAALRDETAAIAARGPDLIPSIDFGDIEGAVAVAAFGDALKRCGVGVIRGVVPAADAEAWVGETRTYMETKHDIKPPAPQDPTCFDYFWTPAQIRARAHPHVLRAMKFAMGFWDANDDDRMATRFPISYADRIRIHVGGSADKAGNSAADSVASAAAGPAMAQVDGGSLERWEPDGYGRGGTYDSIFRGEWEAYDPWDPAGRVNATPDLYNGAGACSIFRMFQGLLALTAVKPGMVRLLPSPKLVTAYFLLRPFFAPRKPPPEAREGPEWDAFLAPENWALEEEPSTIIHGAVPGHAQRVTALWHPHLCLQDTLMTPPNLQAGDYIIWHCETAYTILSSSAETSRPATPAAEGAPPRPAPLMVYAPSCPLTQTNALYLARQRKAFLRGHPGPDFDSTGTGLGTEAPHVGRLGDKEIEETGGIEGLRAMGLAPWDVSTAGNAVAATTTATAPSTSGGDASSNGDRMEVDDGSDKSSRSTAEAELVRLANIILFPDKYEFYMATRNSTPEGGRDGTRS